MQRQWSLALVAVGLCLIITAVAQYGNFFGEPEAVPEISAQQLRKMQRDQLAAEKEAADRGTENPEPSFVLVDVRSEEEQAVSVIPGAITAEQYEKRRDDYQGRTVIAYCTIGYRSEKYARKLLQRDVTAVNFKGSILDWCAAKYPLETLQREPTNRVHTYSSRYHVPPEYQAVW
jgi:rhodanese-related sulfurtransferase